MAIKTIAAVAGLIAVLLAVGIYVQGVGDDVNQPPPVAAVEAPPPVSVAVPEVIDQPVQHQVQAAAPQVLDPVGVIDQLIEEMETASIAFNAPQQLNIEQTVEIELLLSFQKTIEVLTQKLQAQGRRIGGTIKVSDRMEAVLQGENFTITAITPAIQGVSRANDTQWRWRITPKTEGEHILYLTLNARFLVDGLDTPRTFRSFDRSIVVHITAQQRITGFVKDNWEWLWTAILVPVIGLIWARKGRKKKKKRTQKELEIE